jgi:hypothetical protein
LSIDGIYSLAQGLGATSINGYESCGNIAPQEMMIGRIRWNPDYILDFGEKSRSSDGDSSSVAQAEAETPAPAQQSDVERDDSKLQSTFALQEMISSSAPKSDGTRLIRINSLTFPEQPRWHLWSGLSIE